VIVYKGYEDFWGDAIFSISLTILMPRSYQHDRNHEGLSPIASNQGGLGNWGYRSQNAQIMTLSSALYPFEFRSKYFQIHDVYPIRLILSHDKIPLKLVDMMLGSFICLTQNTKITVGELVIGWFP